MAKDKTEKVENETNADRLNRLVGKIAPSVKVGEWGPNGAPYTFTTLEDGRQKLVVEDPETGDRIGVVGKDRNDLLNQLEERVKGRG